MENNQNNNHEQTKKKLKKIGLILLIVGGIFALVGFIDFFASFGGNDMPTMFWCAFIGLPMLGFGGMLTTMGFKQEISRYVKNESVPVINEAGKELSPAIQAVTSAVKEGLQNTENQVRCECGNYNGTDDKFCSECGKALKRSCPNCNAEIETDDKFCAQCGAKLN